MQVPATPPAVHAGGGAPLELVLEVLELLLELVLVLELEELLLELDGGVQHSSEAGPGQWPAVETQPLAAHAETSMQVPATLPTEHAGGGDPLELELLLDVEPVTGPSGVEGSTTTTSTSALSACPCSPPKR